MATRMLMCPRDGGALTEHRLHGVHVDRCGVCRGMWLDPNELGEVEATAADDEVRRGMVEYGERPSELTCPVCGRVMATFNYRAHNVHLDTCSEHGYWLDDGEDRAVLDVIRERKRELRRIPGAEAAWASSRRGDRGGGIGDRLKRFFGR